MDDDYWSKSVNFTNFECRENNWQSEKRKKKEKKEAKKAGKDRTDNVTIDVNGEEDGQDNEDGELVEQKEEKDEDEVKMDPIKQDDFKVDDHWIELNDIPLLMHNVLKNINGTGSVLDINGRYKLENIEDSTLKANENMVEKESVYQIFQFKHEQNPDLSIKYVMNLRGNQRKMKLESKTVDISHPILNSLMYINPNAENEYVGSRVTWVDTKDVMLSVDALGRVSFYCGEILQLILVILCIWQYVIDFIQFHNFINLADTEGIYIGDPYVICIGDGCPDEYLYPDVGVDGWTRYECFGYIMTNSSNMKRFMVFIICMLVLPSSFLARKYTSVGKLFLALMTMHFILLIPIICTHICTYSLVFIWILIIFGVVLFGGFYVWDKIANKCKCCGSLEKYGDALAVAVLFSIFVTFYIFFVLFPVHVMSQIYAEQGYLDTFIDVFNARRTDKYIDYQLEGWNNSFYQIQQFIFWLF